MDEAFDLEKKNHMAQIEWVAVGELKPNPDNPNSHTKDQIARLEKLIRYQGMRWPIIVSNQSGFIAAGHGRLLACVKLGAARVPIIRQDFEDEAQEYAFMVADNAIAEWAQMNMANVNAKFTEFGPDFDIENMGFKDFVFEPSDLPNLPSGPKDPYQQMAFTLHDSQKETVDYAISLAKNLGPFEGSPNQNSNGNALARICQSFVDANLRNEESA